MCVAFVCCVCAVWLIAGCKTKMEREREGGGETSRLRARRLSYVPYSIFPPPPSFAYPRYRNLQWSPHQPDWMLYKGKPAHPERPKRDNVPRHPTKASTKLDMSIANDMSNTTTVRFLVSKRITRWDCVVFNKHKLCTLAPGHVLHLKNGFGVRIEHWDSR